MDYRALNLSLSLSRQDNAAAQPHKRQNESVDEHEAVVETEPQAEPSQSTDPSCCSTRGSPLQQLWTGTGLQHATPRLSTQAPCPGPGDGSYLHPRNSPPVGGGGLTLAGCHTPTEPLSHSFVPDSSTSTAPTSAGGMGAAT